jgi:hypothetical protein
LFTSISAGLKTAVIRWLKQGFTLVPEHSDFFPADLKILNLLNVFSFNTAFNSIFEGKSNVVQLKVHKNENCFGFDFEFCTISLLVMHK